MDASSAMRMSEKSAPGAPSNLSRLLAGEVDAKRRVRSSTCCPRWLRWRLVQARAQAPRPAPRRRSTRGCGGSRRSRSTDRIRRRHISRDAMRRVPCGRSRERRTRSCRYGRGGKSCRPRRPPAIVRPRGPACCSARPAPVRAARLPTCRPSIAQHRCRRPRSRRTSLPLLVNTAWLHEPLESKSPGR